MCQAEVTSSQGCLQRSPNNAATCKAFSRVVRNQLPASPGSCPRLALHKTPWPVRLAHASGQQTPLPTRKNQLQLRVLQHQSHRHRHTFSSFTQGHLAVRQISARVLNGTAQNNHPHMTTHQLLGWARRIGFPMSAKARAARPQSPTVPAPPSRPKACEEQHAAKTKTGSARPARLHHTASQNMGCVMADINLDKTNISIFLKAFKRQKSL